MAVVVYTYVTIIGAVVVLVRVSLTFPVPLPAVLLIPATTALVQAKVAPAVALVAVYPKVVPLQIAAGVRVLLRTGLGFTVMVTFCVLVQVLAVSV